MVVLYCSSNDPMHAEVRLKVAHGQPMAVVTGAIRLEVLKF